MKDRLKEIKYEIYQKSQLIKQLEKEIKALHGEADMIMGYKRIQRDDEKVRSRTKPKR